MPPMPAESVLSVEPWTYDDTPGVLVTLSHHRLRSTRTDEFSLRTLPMLLEYAVERYRQPLGEGGDLRLPPIDPARPLEVYLLRDRAQWRSLTRTLLGPQADPYLRINRGGYAWGGRAVLMDLSPPTHAASVTVEGLDPNRDTLLVAAHEGWHQYTQRSFRQPLPVWLEEGFATVMEGLVDQMEWRAKPTTLRTTSDRTASNSPTGTRIEAATREHQADAKGGTTGWPPANPDRLHDLREIAQSGRLLPLADLLSASPSELLLTTSDARPAVRDAGSEIDRYYSQVWALTLWLMADESVPTASPSHRKTLRGLLADASGIPSTDNAASAEPQRGGSANRLRLRVVEALGSERAAGGSGLLQGPAVFLAYFGHDLDAHDAHYRAFVLRLIAARDDEASAPKARDR